MSATIIRASARVRGSVDVSVGDATGEGAGDLVVEGVVEGDVHVSGQLTIGRHARIGGAIVARDVKIAGKLMRSVQASGIVHLTATAEVHGDLEATRVVIDDGAMFEGQVRLLRGARAHAEPPVAHAVTHTPVTQTPVATLAPRPASREVPALGMPGRRRAQRRSH